MIDHSLLTKFRKTHITENILEEMLRKTIRQSMEKSGRYYEAAIKKTRQRKEFSPLLIYVHIFLCEFPILPEDFEYNRGKQSFYKMTQHNPESFIMI